MKRVITGGAILKTTHHPDKTMTYKELYQIATNPAADTDPGIVLGEPNFTNWKQNVANMAQFIYSYGYKDQRFFDKEEALWTAFELYEDMTGMFIDPTTEEFDDMVDRIIG